MKFLKKTILLFTLVISFCLLNSNVKAFDSTYDITYDFIYTNIILTAQEKNSDFSFDEYNHFWCTGSFYCFFIKNSDLDKISLKYSNNQILQTTTGEVKYYRISTNINLIPPTVRFSTLSSTNTFSANIYTNISEYKDLTNVVYLDDGVEEPKELEVTIKGSELLNFMLDKTKNIYEVLIANQIFVLCLGVLLSYLIFIILYKIIRK